MGHKIEGSRSSVKKKATTVWEQQQRFRKPTHAILIEGGYSQKEKHLAAIVETHEEASLSKTYMINQVRSF